MLVLPDDILFQISETQKPNPNLVSDEEPSVKIKDKLKAVFRKNLIKKESEFGNYSKEYFKSTFDFLIKSQEKFWDKLNRFVFGNEIFDGEKTEENYSFLEKLFGSRDNDEEVTCPICPGPLNNGFISKIFRAIKKIYDAFDFFLNLKKWYNKAKNLYDIIRKWGGNKKASIKKFYNTVRKVFSKSRSRLSNFWKRFIKPILKKLWNLLKRMFKRAKSLIRKAFNVFKKLFNRVKRWVMKRVRRLFIKAFKKMVKFVAKTAAKWLLRIVGTALASTGILAVIGAAIIAASWAWEAYDLVRPEPPEPDDEEDEEPEYKNLNTPDEEEREIKRELNKSQPPAKNRPAIVTETNIAKLKKAEENPQYKKDGRLRMGLGKDRYKDDILNALYEHSNDYYVIFGSLYEFYRYCFKWLKGQEDFAIKCFESLNKGINDFIEKYIEKSFKHLKYKKEDWIKYHIDTYRFHPWENRNRTKPKPKDWQVEERFKKVYNFVEENWNHGLGKEYGYLGLRFKLGSLYVASTDLKKGKEKAGTSYKGGNAPGKWMEKLIPELKQSNEYYLRKYEKYKEYNPADISHFDNVKLVNVSELMKRLNVTTDAKIKEMKTKNELLYDFWNRAAWIESTFNKSMSKSGYFKNGL